MHTPVDIEYISKRCIRHYFAGQALHAIIQAYGPVRAALEQEQDIAKRAWDYADAMIAEMSKRYAKD